MSMAFGLVLSYTLGSFFPFVLCQNNSTTPVSSAVLQNSTNGMLDFQPHFARSLPVQLLIGGIVLTLSFILLVHLCFTWQYHWPLGRINWILQFTGACSLLLNVTFILWIVLTALSEKSREWPYMFEYIAIDVPRISSWSIPEIVAWFVMEAATSALVAITHIQFLTFLYPSKLEARLVFILLGPLAIVSSVMTLLPIATYSEAHAIAASTSNLATSNSTNYTTVFVRSAASMYRDRQQLYDIVDAARNICNLTLSLLFTLSLMIWGFFVNRQSAWRTDGGTAIFGAGALFLALISTVLNFIKVFTSPTFEWLSSLLWAVILWQSFLGWWWWVGSASDIAERAEQELREAERLGRKERKRSRRKKRQAIAASSQDEEFTGTTTGAMARLDRWRSSVGATISRRRPPPETSQTQSHSENSPPGSVELSTVSSIPSIPGESGRDTTSIQSSNSNSIFASMRRAWRSIRQAHIRAARVQAIEQRDIQLQMQLENGHGLGRFPGGPGNDIDMHVFRLHADGSDGELSPPRLVRDPPRTSKQAEGSRFSGLSLSQTIRKWRLRDSTTY